jgi:hypothetical protein
MAAGYSPAEAVQRILEKNLFALDLDRRVAQLAQFALLLKAAQYSSAVLQRGLLPHIYAMPPHRVFTCEEVLLFTGDEQATCAGQLLHALQVMEQAYNLGSIMQPVLDEQARKAVAARLVYWQQKIVTGAGEKKLQADFTACIPILLILTNRFACIAANPPYMGQKNMNAALKQYVNRHYPLSRNDLFAVFMEVCTRLLQPNGRYGMINMQSWMFLSSYKALRKDLLATQTIESMLHLGPRTFDELGGEVVQSTAFVMQKKRGTAARGVYYRLVEYKSSDEKKIAFHNRAHAFNNMQQTDFANIPGSPIAYWMSDRVMKWFHQGHFLKDLVTCRSGMSTSDNKRFTRKWYEVDYNNLCLAAGNEQEGVVSGKKWFPYNKGGDYRKWGSQMNVVINWYNAGEEIKKAVVQNPKDPGTNHWSRRVYNTDMFFKEGLTWSKIATGDFSTRYLPAGCISDVAGCTLFCSKDQLYYLLGLLNSRLSEIFIKSLSPTVNYEVYQVESFPVAKEFVKKEEIEHVVSTALAISKRDWDSRETSWGFQYNPLVATQQINLEQSYRQWLQQASQDFLALHACEETINRVFIDSYGLREEVSPEVALEEITILQEELDYDALANMQRPYTGALVPVQAGVVMQQLISYITGIAMGRYQAGEPGLYRAHGGWQPAHDAMIPLMGNNGHFADDLLHRVKTFLCAVWGEEALAANIHFMEQQLQKKLDHYLVNHFWKYHVKMYDRKPIYWLFASKKKAFQVLVYMHRMHASTLTIIRDKYLAPHISWLQQVADGMEKQAGAGDGAVLKQYKALHKQLAECREYDVLLQDMANRQIVFDLDDGVAKNHSLFTGVVAEIK